MIPRYAWQGAQTTAVSDEEFPYAIGGESLVVRTGTMRILLAGPLPVGGWELEASVLLAQTAPRKTLPMVMGMDLLERFIVVCNWRGDSYIERR